MPYLNPMTYCTMLLKKQYFSLLSKIACQCVITHVTYRMRAVASRARKTAQRLYKSVHI